MVLSSFLLFDSYPSRAQVLLVFLYSGISCFCWELRCIFLNSIFIKYVTLQDLQDRVAEAISNNSKEELMKVSKEIVDFHGEMVLLENYSALNYTGMLL